MTKTVLTTTQSTALVASRRARHSAAMSDDTRSPGIVKRLLRGGLDPVELQRRSVEARRARKLARELAALERAADDDRAVRVPDEPASRRPFQSCRAYDDERAAASTGDELERAPVREWSGRPRTSARMASPDVPDEALTPGQFDRRHGIVSPRKLRRSVQWWDRRAERSGGVWMAAQLRGEDFRF